MAAKPKPSKPVKGQAAKAQPAKATALKAKPAKAAAKAQLKAAKTSKKARPARLPAELPVAAVVETYYVSLVPLSTQIHSAAPAQGCESTEFASFAAAKERAIDQLIELIEEAERRLHATRRASDFADYQRAFGV